jgi:hypothetical protein
MKSRPVRAIVVGGLVTGLVVIGEADQSITTAASSAARATAAVPAVFTALPESSALRTGVLASGTVRTANGARASSGHVLVYAWPNDSVIESGRPFNRVPVSRATIGTDGTFTARIAPTVNLRPHANAGNIVDFDVRAVTGGGMGVSGFSRRVTASGGLGRAFDNRGPSTPAPGTNGPAVSNGSKVVGGVPVVTMSTHATQGTIRSSPQTAATAGSSDCRTLKTYLDRPVLVGQIYHYARGVPARITYLRSSTSTVGVGYTVAGSGGKWWQSTTLTKPRSTDLVRGRGR